MSANVRDLARLMLRNVTNIQNDLKAFLNCLEEEPPIVPPIAPHIARERAMSNSSQTSSSSSASSEAPPRQSVLQVKNKPAVGAKRSLDAGGDTKPEKKAKISRDDAPKKVKKVKDPNEPKRPMTGFLLYNQDHREAIVKANPTAKTTEIMGMLAAQWKDASLAVKEKYGKKAESAKADYAAAKKVYDDEKAEAAPTRVSFSEPPKAKAATAKAAKAVDFHSAFDEAAWDEEEVEHKKKKKKEKKEKKEKKDRESIIFEDDDE